MKKAILFIRVSTDKQEFISQEQDLKRQAIADGFNNNNIITIGNHESGYKLEEEERIGLQNLKNEISKNDIDTIYIWEITRLSRKPKVIYSIRDFLLEHKVQLKCLKPMFCLLREDRTGFESTANIVLSIMGALGEQEIIEKKERFKRGKKRLAEEGKYSGGRIPYGYKLSDSNNKFIIIDNDEAEIIRLIYNLYENGMSQTIITKELNARGYKYKSFNPREKGNLKEFNIWFVNQILTNELLTGRKCKGANSSYYRSYPSIISEEQFDHCRELAKSRSTTSRKRKNIYYAKGIITCPECKCKFSSSGSKVSYRCYNANMPKTIKVLGNTSNKRVCKNKTSISINAIDSLLWQLAKEEELRYIFSTAKEEINKHNEQLNILNIKLSNITPRLSEYNNRKKRVALTFTRGLIDETDLNKEIDEIEKKIKELKNEQVKILSEISHINELITNINVAQSVNTENIISEFTKVDSIRKQISEITDDNERFNIIHRHIKEAFIGKTETKEINFWSGKKNAIAKFITINYYNGEVKYFWHVPNAGGKCRFFISNESKDVLEDYVIVFLKRFVDKTKIVQKEKKKKEKDEAWKADFDPNRKYIKGLTKLGQYLNVSVSTILRYIKQGRLEGAYKKFRYDQKTYIFDAELCLKIIKG